MVGVVGPIVARVVGSVAASCFSIPGSGSCLNIMAESASLLSSAVSLEEIWTVLPVLLLPAVAPPTQLLVRAGIVLAVSEAFQLVEIPS